MHGTSSPDGSVTFGTIAGSINSAIFVSS